MATKVVLAVASFMAVTTSATEFDWGYGEDNGPATWSRNYPECGGSNQSPVDIISSNDTAWPKLTWLRYSHRPNKLTLNNNGHVVQLVAEWGRSGILSHPQLELGDEGGARRQYQLANVHFHWGRQDTEGSEHTFQGRKYPLEMHAVHTRVVKGVPVEPVEYVVAAYFFKISPLENPSLELFLQDLPRVREANSSLSLHPFSMRLLLPQFHSHFLTYQGSVTSPPCREAATFLLWPIPQTISKAQMNRFRVLLNREGSEMSGNWRPTQPLNGRVVYRVVTSQGSRRPRT